MRVKHDSLCGGLLPDVVAVGFFGDELGGVGEGLLRVGVEFGDAARVGLAADGGGGPSVPPVKTMAVKSRVTALCGLSTAMRWMA